MSILTFHTNSNHALYQFDLHEADNQYTLKAKKLDGNFFSKLCSDSLKNVATSEKENSSMRVFQRLFVKVSKEPELGNIKIESRIYAESLKWFFRLQGRITQCFENGSDLYVVIPTLDPQPNEKALLNNLNSRSEIQEDLSAMLWKWNKLISPHAYLDDKK